MISVFQGAGVGFILDRILNSPSESLLLLTSEPVHSGHSSSPSALITSMQFLLGAMSTSHSILIVLAGDLAGPARRGSATATVFGGILLGMLFGRVFGGFITEFGSVRDLYFTSFGLQVSEIPFLWCHVPPTNLARSQHQ